MVMTTPAKLQALMEADARERLALELEKSGLTICVKAIRDKGHLATTRNIPAAPALRVITELLAENARLAGEIDRFQHPADRDLSTDDPITPLPNFQPQHLLGLALLFREWCEASMWGGRSSAELAARQMETAYARIIAAETEARALREAGRRVLAEKAPSYHDCIDNGESQCAWCDLEQALSGGEKA